MHSYKATYRMALAILISFYQYHRQPRNCHLKLCFCLCSDAPFQSEILVLELPQFNQSVRTSSGSPDFNDRTIICVSVKDLFNTRNELILQRNIFTINISIWKSYQINYNIYNQNFRIFRIFGIFRGTIRSLSNLMFKL